MSWTETRVGTLLGTRYPLIQAPMAGGPTTPQLIAAVSNAGGLGAMGAATMAPQAIGDSVRAVRQLTDRPFSINLFVPSPVECSAAELAAAERALRPFRERLGLPAPTALAAAQDFDAQLAVAIEEKVPVFSFTFGALAEQHLAALKAASILVLGTATTIAEAQHLERLGVDIVVAQGCEAGGHRGTFLGNAEDGMIGTLSLVPRMADAVTIPVVAAGGIMDGRGIAAALTLGAQGVQLGTAFLACPEAGTHPLWRKRLLAAQGDPTALTRAFTGKTARGLRNLFIAEMAGKLDGLPAYPALDLASRDIRMAAAQKGDDELMAMWAGQGASRCRDLPAAALVAALVEETDAALTHFGAR